MSSVRVRRLLAKWPPWLREMCFLMVLIGVCLANYWIFPKFAKRDYLQWYVDAGPFIGLATATFAQAWGNEDKNIGLISAKPSDYVGACCQVVGLPINVFGGHLRSAHHPNGLPWWELATGLPLIIVFLVAALGWLLLISPLQYFVFLICGAPARIAMTSLFRVDATLDGTQVKLKERTIREPPPDPKVWWDASMRDKPVTLTNAFSAAALLIIGQFWN